MEELKLYTIQDVANLLKISTSMMYCLVESGKFSHVKLGTNIRFTRDHISAFLADASTKKDNDTTFPSPVNLQKIYDQFNTIPRRKG